MIFYAISSIRTIFIENLNSSFLEVFSLFKVYYVGRGPQVFEKGTKVNSKGKAAYVISEWHQYFLIAD